MRLKHLWVVLDPTAVSELSDVCWKQEAATLHVQILMLERDAPGAWERRQAAFYTDEAEAKADAVRRLKAAAKRLHDAAVQATKGRAP